MSAAGDAINEALDSILDGLDVSVTDVGEAIAHHPAFRHWVAAHDTRRREGERRVWEEATAGFGVKPLPDVSTVARYMESQRWKG